MSGIKNDLSEANCRYEPLIRKILKEVPSDIVPPDEIAKLYMPKFLEFFKKEDAYAIFLSITFELILAVSRANRCQEALNNIIKNHNIEIVLIKSEDA